MANKSAFFLKKTISPERTMLRINKLVAKKMKPVLNKHVKRRDKLVQPWSSQNQPTFTVIDPEITVTEVIGKVHLSANNARMASISVYELLDDGTKVRHVRMTPDFRAKTVPGRITSGAGAGGVIRGINGDPIIFRNAGPDGIKAREFDKTINELLEEDMKEAIKTALQEGLQRPVFVGRRG